VSVARGDVAPGFAARSLCVWRTSQDTVRDWRPSPCAGPVGVFGQRSATARPATIALRTHECGTDGHIAGTLRDPLG
jgi:hypothetical protein